MDRIRICAICMHCEVGKIEENLRKIEEFSIKAKDADIICFPELSITGYSIKKPVFFSFEEITEDLKSIAKKTGSIIVAGAAEPSESLPWITQIVVRPDGKVEKYRKTHLSPVEKGIYREGDEIRIFSADSIRFGIQLCYETHFPEISTIMALMGADLILAPHASPRGTPEEKLESWLRHLRARAFDNCLFIVACNQTGKTKEGLSFPGVAVAIGPDGRLKKSILTEKEDMLFITLKKDEIKEIRKNPMRYFLPYRRPELYSFLLKKRDTPK